MLRCIDTTVMLCAYLAEIVETKVTYICSNWTSNTFLKLPYSRGYAVLFGNIISKFFTKVPFNTNNSLRSSELQSTIFATCFRKIFDKQFSLSQQRNQNKNNLITTNLWTCHSHCCISAVLVHANRVISFLDLHHYFRIT